MSEGSQRYPNNIEDFQGELRNFLTIFSSLYSHMKKVYFGSVKIRFFYLKKFLHLVVCSLLDSFLIFSHWIVFCIFVECHFRTRGLYGLIRHQIRLKFQLSILLQKFTSRLWSAVLSYRAVKWPNRTPIILCRQTTSAYSANTDSYLKDTTDFITLIENTKVPSNAILVTSLNTNIPQEEGITLVCQACETFHDKNSPIATH